MRFEIGATAILSAVVEAKNEAEAWEKFEQHFKRLTLNPTEEITEVSLDGIDMDDLAEIEEDE